MARPPKKLCGNTFAVRKNRKGDFASGEAVRLLGVLLAAGKPVRHAEIVRSLKARGGFATMNTINKLRGMGLIRSTILMIDNVGQNAYVAAVTFNALAELELGQGVDSGDRLQ